METVFDFGEKKIVKILVKNLKNDPFTILNAKYELIGEFSTEPEASGDADIIEHTISALIEPKEHCDYDLRFIYHIGVETLVDIVKVKMR